MTIEEKFGRAKYDLEYMHTIGYEKGQSDGYAEGVEAGMDAEWNEFWGVFQQKGARLNYEYAFAYGWDDDSFRPKYDIRPTHAANMFKGSKITDLKALLEERGITLDTSQTENNISYMFSESSITVVPAIDLSGATLDNFQTSGVFGWANALHTIDKLILKDDGSTVIHPNWFISSANIANITIEGLIGMSISFLWSVALTPTSMKNIINHLVDYSGTDKANAYKLTFAETCWLRLEADSTAPDGGTWREYVRSKGWNV